jgi:ABC-2 type transport system ATP-binding protein
MNVVEANGLVRKFGAVTALDGFDLCVPSGRIVGLIGPNGSGKTTALRAILGLTPLEAGSLNVAGCNPWQHRHELMRNVAYIPDTGILPRWMRVRDLIDYAASVHPAFERARAERLLAKTAVAASRTIGTLSKGMQVQLHLSLILAINAKLLVLDEPTLGLDVLYREQFYETLLGDFMEGDRSILVTTHEVREIEHVLTDVVFIRKGKSVLAEPIDTVRRQYTKLTTGAAASVPRGYLSRRHSLAGVEYLYRDVSRDQLEGLGNLSTPNLVELFVACMETDQKTGDSSPTEAAHA